MIMVRALPIVLLSLTCVLPLGAAENIEKLARKCQSGNQQACARLADIAKGGRDPRVRQAALEKLTDQAALAHIAKTDGNPEVRRTAFMRLLAGRVCGAPVGGMAAWRQSEKVYISSHLFFARDVPPEIEARIQKEILGVLESALRALGLTPVAGDHAESVIEIEAFGEAESARYSLSGIGGSRLYTGANWQGAIRLAHDECVYLRTVAYDREPPARVGLHPGESGPTGASEAPFGDAMRDMLVPAVAELAENLGGAADLNRLAKGSNAEVGLAAVRRLADQALLADIAKTASDWRVRGDAVDKVTDQAALADIAKTDPAPNVRRIAVNKLTDQAVLAHIAKSDRYGEVRQAGVWRLTDQALLADIAKSDSQPFVLLAAVEKLTDQALLADIAKTGTDETVRAAAKRRLAELAR
jgi:hypothetical protein